MQARRAGKLEIPLYGRQGPLFHFRRLADETPGTSPSGIPRCQFYVGDSPELDGMIRWDHDARQPEISVNYGWHLHALNTALWLTSHSHAVVDPTAPFQQPPSESYSGAERTLWEPRVDVTGEGEDAVFVPQYYRPHPREGYIVPRLVNPAVRFVLAHHLAHFACGHWHLLASHTRDSTSRFSERPVAGPATGASSLWQCAELDADSLGVRAALEAEWREHGRSASGPTQLRSIHQRLELALTAIMATIGPLPQDDRRPAGCIRVLHVLLEAIALDGNGALPVGVCDSRLALRTLAHAESLGRLLDCAMPTVQDLEEAADGQATDSGSAAGRYLALVSHQPRCDEAFDGFRRLALASAQDRQLHLQ
jgi:hypothetical protein